MIGAQKQVVTGDENLRFEHLCAQTHEALVILAMQSMHPSGHGCPNLPTLLAANWEVQTAPDDAPGTAKERAIAVNDLLMEVADAGSVHGIMKRRRAEAKALMLVEPVLPHDFKWSVSMGIAEALLHMHEAHWLHCDVKPANVILHASGRPVLTDLGLAQRLGESTRAFGGTPGYMAPELARARRDKTVLTLTRTLDVFALGVTMLQMALPAGAVEATGLSDTEVQRLNAEGLLPGVLLAGRLDCDGAYRHIVTIATRPCPSERPTLKNVYSLIQAGWAAGVHGECGLTAPVELAPGHAAATTDGPSPPAPADAVPSANALHRLKLRDSARVCAASGAYDSTPRGALVATPEHASPEHAAAGRHETSWPRLGDAGSPCTPCGGSPRPLPITQSLARAAVRPGRMTYAAIAMRVGTKFE